MRCADFSYLWGGARVRQHGSGWGDTCQSEAEARSPACPGAAPRPEIFGCEIAGATEERSGVVALTV